VLVLVSKGSMLVVRWLWGRRVHEETEVETLWVLGVTMRILAGVGEALEGLAKDVAEDESGTGTGTDFEDLWRVAEAGLWLGSNFAEKTVE
jgi:hypothetical protein